MAKKLYVGNLTYGVTDSDLQNLFAPHGTVQSAQVIMDRDTRPLERLRLCRDGQRRAGASGHHRPERPGSQRAGAHRQRSPATRRTWRRPAQWWPDCLAAADAIKPF